MACLCTRWSTTRVGGHDPGAAGGTSFAYIKATEGVSYSNPYFTADYQAARNAGLYVGAYVFARPDLANPVGQADYFVNQSLWTVDSQTLIPFVDIEWPYVTAESAGTKPLVANRSAIGSWETFTLVSNVDGSESLLANANHRYVTAGASAPIANASTVDTAQEYDLTG